MKTTIFVLAIISMVFVGLTAAEDFIKGEAKGSDAPGAMMIGEGNQSGEVLEMSGLNFDAVNQAFGVRGVDLSNVSPSVFEQPWMKKDGWMSAGGSFRTPSINAFLNDRTGENLRWSPKQGDF